FGRGFGRGFRHWFKRFAPLHHSYAVPYPVAYEMPNPAAAKTEKEWLLAEKAMLEKELQEIDDLLDKLEDKD
ncbi:MAG TPA: DUF5320 domain-containing protein, partial [Limnochordia bacterium]|nr:DUF5320 domain-containing protein [Limnochordia bacterium]